MTRPVTISTRRILAAVRYFASYFTAGHEKRLARKRFDTHARLAEELGRPNPVRKAG